MKKGTVLEGIVNKIQFPNKGIVEVDGEKAIVKNALPGQNVRFVVNKSRKGKGEGRLLEVLERSPRECLSKRNHHKTCQTPLLHRQEKISIPSPKEARNAGLKHKTATAKNTWPRLSLKFFSYRQEFSGLIKSGIIFRPRKRRPSLSSFGHASRYQDVMRTFSARQKPLHLLKARQACQARSPFHMD